MTNKNSFNGSVFDNNIAKSANHRENLQNNLEILTIKCKITNIKINIGKSKNMIPVKTDMKRINLITRMF